MIEEIKKAQQSFKNPLVTNRLHVRLVFLILKVWYWWYAFRLYKNPIIAVKSLNKLEQLKVRFFGRKTFQKISRVEDGYFWMAGGPKLFSPSMKTFIKVGLHKIIPVKHQKNGLQVLFLAITRKCPLRCEHCFEGPNLARTESLSVQELKEIIHHFQEKGVAQIQFSGGEPMSRFDDMIELLESKKSGTDFWLNTSGFLLDLEKARILKKAGLTGVIVSLDHFEEDLHNAFRKNNDAYRWAMRAIEAVKAVEMPITLSLCATSEFITKENLFKYAMKGKEMGVTFIQLLEPKQVGFYENKDILLSEEKKKILRDFYFLMAFDNRYRDWPIVNYMGYHNESAGCLGAGDRFLYINSKGEINACPFCHKNYGNIKNEDIDANIMAMKNESCPLY